MRNLNRVVLATVLSVPLFSVPAVDAAVSKKVVGVPTGAVIEKVIFDVMVPTFEQGLVLDRISVKPGDVLTTDTIQRIGRQLLTLRVPYGFSYVEGARPGQVVLSIGAGC